MNPPDDGHDHEPDDPRGHGSAHGTHDHPETTTTGTTSLDPTMWEQP
jgi:hypothetical protein